MACPPVHQNTQHHFPQVHNLKIIYCQINCIYYRLFPINSQITENTGIACAEGVLTIAGSSIFRHNEANHHSQCTKQQKEHYLSTDVPACAPVLVNVDGLVGRVAAASDIFTYRYILCNDEISFKYKCTALAETLFDSHFGGAQFEFWPGHVLF